MAEEVIKALAKKAVKKAVLKKAIMNRIKYRTIFKL
jgi:hypothetical protein